LETRMLPLHHARNLMIFSYLCSFEESLV